MADEFRGVGEYRLQRHLKQLQVAVNTTDPVAVPAAAADLLDALYALTRHWRDNLIGESTYNAECRATLDGKIVGGLTHLRGKGVHHAVVLSNFTDRIAEYYYDHYGCWVWNPGAQTDSGELSAMYRSSVADKEVLVTLPSVKRFCFEQLPASTVPQTQRTKD